MNASDQSKKLLGAIHQQKRRLVNGHVGHGMGLLVTVAAILGCSPSSAPPARLDPSVVVNSVPAVASSAARSEDAGVEDRAPVAALEPALERIKGECINPTLRRKLTIGDGTFMVSRRVELQTTEVAGRFNVTSANPWSVTADYDSPNASGRKTISILDNGQLWLHQFGHGRLCEPVKSPVAHPPAGELRAELTAKLQGRWQGTTQLGSSLMVAGSSVLATVNGVTHRGTFAVRVASKGLLIVDLTAAQGKKWIAIAYLKSDGGLDGELREPVQREGWISHGGGSFVRPAP